jgi:hypothetical protein
MASLFEYLGIFFTQWWLVVSAIPTISALIGWFNKAWEKKINEHSNLFKRGGIVLFIIGIFLAGYFAWKEQFQKLEILQSKIPANSTQYLKDEIERLKLQIANSEIQSWQELSVEQVERLKLELKKLSPLQVTINCVSNNCKKLADSFESIFSDLGWQVEMVAHDIWDRGPNIRLFPYNETTQFLGKAITDVTGFVVVLTKPKDGPYVGNEPDKESNIHIWIGDKLDM